MGIPATERLPLKVTLNSPDMQEAWGVFSDSARTRRTGDVRAEIALRQRGGRRMKQSMPRHLNAFMPQYGYVMFSTTAWKKEESFWR